MVEWWRFRAISLTEGGLENAKTRGYSKFSTDILTLIKYMLRARKKIVRTLSIKKPGKTVPPEAKRTPETPPETANSRKTPEFIAWSGEICKKVKFYPPNPNPNKTPDKPSKSSTMKVAEKRFKKNVETL